MTTKYFVSNTNIYDIMKTDCTPSSCQYANRQKNIYSKKNRTDICIVYTEYEAEQHTHTQPFYGSMDFVWDNPG